MRIIDWSSDVCSSDLPNNHDSVPIDLWREEQVHPDDIARVEAAVTAHLEGRSEFYETEHRVRHRSAGWVRSEEHTSELQSLMRISYAVFCLKKKKTTQHNDQIQISTNHTDTIH